MYSVLRVVCSVGRSHNILCTGVFEMAFLSRECYQRPHRAFLFLKPLGFRKGGLLGRPWNSPASRGRSIQYSLPLPLEMGSCNYTVCSTGPSQQSLAPTTYDMDLSTSTREGLGWRALIVLKIAGECYKLWCDPVMHRGWPCFSSSRTQAHLMFTLTELKKIQATHEN